MNSSPVTLTNPGTVRSAYGINRDLKTLDTEKTDTAEKGAETVPSFEESLKAGLQRVNTLQMQAETSMQRMVTGDVDDISEVAAAVSEADLALRFAVQVRDKLLDAYNQLIKISL